MTPKFFLLPALAVVLAFVGLTSYSHVAFADDNDCVCDPAGIPDGGSAVNLIDPNDEQQVADYLDAINNCDDPAPSPPICTLAGCEDDGPEESCPGESISIGAIQATASKTAPLYPMVIGQDDTKRGADISCSVTVEPSTRTSYSRNAKGKCVKNVETFYETATAQAILRLDAASRDWILNGDLQTRYPGAYLHNPDMNIGVCAGGANAQIADPGRFNITVVGTTSGTPVQGPRSFTIIAGNFLAYLREIVITK
jgi:hypothetical protein